jgi:hypothetical protein
MLAFVVNFVHLDKTAKTNMQASHNNLQGVANSGNEFERGDYMPTFKFIPPLSNATFRPLAGDGYPS